MGEVSGYTLVAKALKAMGVTHVCSVPGGPVLETLAACAGEGIRPIGMRNEQAAVMMAAAQNYSSGTLACVPILASGPGTTNAVTGVLVAKDNCWPLLVLGGRSALNTKEMGTFQELDGVPVFRPLTKWSSVVDSTVRLPEFLERGARAAISGRPGPVFLDLPQDVLLAKVEEDTVPMAEGPVSGGPASGSDPAAVRRAAELLLGAQKPLMVIGKGVRWSEPFRELHQIVETLGMPFLTSPMGRGFIPDDHPLCFSAARSMAQREADVILLAGTRLNWTFRLGTELNPDAKIIQIDIDPTEIGLNRKPAVGLVGDVKAVLGQIIGELEGKTAGLAERAAESPWISSLREKRAQNEEGLGPFIHSDSVPIWPHRMLQEIKESIPRDATVVVDGNIILGAGRQVIPSYEPATRLNSGSNGCMGVGVPFAIGAKLARPDKPVIGIIGDCAFGFSAMEMETALRHNIPVVYLIANNDGISGSGIQEAHLPNYQERVMMYMPDIHYERVITAFGGYAEYVERPEDIKPALQRALDSGTTACINVKLDPAAPFPGPGGQMRSQRAMLQY